MEGGRAKENMVPLLCQGMPLTEGWVLFGDREPCRRGLKMMDLPRWPTSRPCCRCHRAAARCHFSLANYVSKVAPGRGMESTA